jgi:hypothetical protein
MSGNPDHTQINKNPKPSGFWVLTQKPKKADNDNDNDNDNDCDYDIYK